MSSFPSHFHPSLLRAIICIAKLFHFYLTGDTSPFLDLTLHLSLFLSKASLGLRDIDFDAVWAFCSRVLAKWGSFLSSQQPLASLLSLFLSRGRRRAGWKVCTLLTAKQWSPLTRLPWRCRGCLLLVLCLSEETWQKERRKCEGRRRKDSYMTMWENNK